MSEWRVHVVSKLQSPGQTFVLTAGQADPKVLIDPYGKDMASATWILRLVNGNPFNPPGPPPRDSVFNLIHESSQRSLVFPEGWRRGQEVHGVVVHETQIPNTGEMRLLSANPALQETLFRFDALTAPYLAINDYNRKRVLDIESARTEPGTPVVGWGWNGGDNQQWKLEFVNA